MGYIEDDSMVRVSFFKQSGKWYTDEAVKWTGAWKGRSEHGNPIKTQLIHDAFRTSLQDHVGDTNRLKEFDAICLEPYHEFSHPIMLKSGDW